MVYLLAALLVREARLAVAAHDALASPDAHAAAQVGLPTLAHAAVSAEGLRTWKSFLIDPRYTLLHSILVLSNDRVRRRSPGSDYNPDS